LFNSYQEAPSAYAIATRSYLTIAKPEHSTSCYCLYVRNPSDYTIIRLLLR